MSEFPICWQKMTDAELEALKNLLLSLASTFVAPNNGLLTLSNEQLEAIRHRGDGSLVAEVINRTVSQARYDMRVIEETHQRTLKQINEISAIQLAREQQALSRAIVDKA